MRHRGCFVVLVCACAVARADEPKYEFAKPDEVKGVVWKASANLGLLGTYGNSRSVALSGALNISRNDGKNKIALDAAGAYSQSWTRSLVAIVLTTMPLSTWRWQAGASRYCPSNSTTQKRQTATGVMCSR